MRYSIRDVFWLTLVVSILIGWYLHWRTWQAALSSQTGRIVLQELESKYAAYSELIENAKKRVLIWEGKTEQLNGPTTETIAMELRIAQTELRISEMTCRALKTRIEEIRRSLEP